MMRFYILLTLSVALQIPLQAQISKDESNTEHNFVRCYTTEMTEALAQKSQTYKKSINNFENWLKPFIRNKELLRTDSSDTITIIPVVFHIIHNGNKINSPGNIYGENISYQQVASQIQVLNEDFLRIINTPGYDTIGYNLGVNTKIRFQLANKAPDGTATNGINRITKCEESWDTNAIEEKIKPSTIWDPSRYLNIWSVRFKDEDVLGYAQPPVQSGLDGIIDNYIANTDGLVANFDAIGTIAEDDGSFVLNATYNQGRTLTHEVGHWLGLKHIWGDGDCSVDDYVSDTPNSDEPNYGCPVNRMSCGSVDMIENYMDYTNDICMNTFTQGQKERMHTVLRNSPRRKELIYSDAFDLVNYTLDGKLTNACYKEFITAPCDGLDILNFNLNLFNTASTPITSATIAYGANGVMHVYEWTGNLNQFDYETITLSLNLEILENGQNEIEAKILKINGNVDEVETNNRLSFPYDYERKIMHEYTENQFVLTIVPNMWANELSWEVQNSEGNIVVSGGGNYPKDSTDPIEVQFELSPNACYTFHMKDEFGDGIESPGYYTLKTMNGVTVVTGGDFEQEDITPFTIGSLSIEDFEENQFKIYPNPTQGKIYIQHPSLHGVYEVKVFNMNGQMVYNQVHKNQMINLQGLEPGMYILQFAAEGKTFSKKLILK